MIGNKYHLALFLCFILQAGFAYSQTAVPTQIKTQEVVESKTSETQETSSLYDDSNIIESVFFSDDEIKNITEIKLLCEKNRDLKKNNGIEEDDFLKRLEELSNGKKLANSFTYPQFFLSSIVYHSPNDWVVWVNGKKIIPNSEQKDAKLKVVSINAQKVTFEWIPERMDKIQEPEDSSVNNGINIDTINSKVLFTLKGNQTFTTYSMKIVEGRVLPVTVSNTQ